MTVALLQPDGTVAIGHVGDSRAYRLRDGLLEQLTDDHSLVAELVRRGELSPEEAAVHPQRSVITRALGTEADVDVDAFTVEAQRRRPVPALLGRADDDGRRRRRSPRSSSGTARASTTAAKALIRAANDRGGDDNITAILFSVAEGGDDQDATVELRGPRAGGRPGRRGHAPSGGPRDAARSSGSRPERPSRDVTDDPVGGRDRECALEAEPRTAARWCPVERASTARLVLAVLVIVALVAAIVLLVLEALPR